MIASNYNKGNKFKNINTNLVWEVVDIGEYQYFLCENGDVSGILDEDLFQQIA